MDNQRLVYEELRKLVVNRILEFTKNLDRSSIEQMSLRAQLNLLFLVCGTYGCIGDSGSTERVLRHLVGDALYTEWPEPVKAESTAVQ